MSLLRSLRCLSSVVPRSTSSRLSGWSPIPPIAQVRRSTPIPTMRYFNTYNILRGGGNHDHHHDGDHFHGHDFLDRANIERRVKLVLSGIDKIDQTKIHDLNRLRTERRQTNRQRGIGGKEYIQRTRLREHRCTDCTMKELSSVRQFRATIARRHN